VAAEKCEGEGFNVGLPKWSTVPRASDRNCSLYRCCPAVEAAVQGPGPLRVQYVSRGRARAVSTAPFFVRWGSRKPCRAN
jgi:hypothetical protein